MGWWVANAENGRMAQMGNASASDAAQSPMWGDGPADIFGEAIDAIVAEFKEDLGRPPTKTEVRAGLEFALDPLDDDTLTLMGEGP